MPKDAMIQPLFQEYKRLSRIDIDQLIAEKGDIFGVWQGMTIYNFVDDVSDLKNKLSTILDEYPVDQWTYTIVHRLEGAIRDLSNNLEKLRDSKDKSYFDQSYALVDEIKTQIQTCNLLQFNPTNEDIIKKDIEIEKRLIQVDLVQDKTKEIQETIDSLIEPGTAASLSLSFDRRRGIIANFKRFWLVMVSITGVASAGITYAVVEQVIQAMSQSNVGEMQSFAVIFTLRVFFLLPIFTIFILTYLQFSKERGLEEDYAHKAAVATALPNYAGIAVDDTVKDELLSKAGDVIFSSPAQGRYRKSSRTELKLNEFKELFESIRGLVKSD